MGQTDAAGDTTFIRRELPTPGTCVNYGGALREGGKIKICGPGTFTLSRMSCDKHDYKAVTITQATDQFTASDCRVYTLSDEEYYAVNGYVGSATYKCDATAR